jgi:transposase
MCRVREILRLKFAAKPPIREIARLVGTAPSTVRAGAGTLSRWPGRCPSRSAESDLEAALYANIGRKQRYRRLVEPDWALIHRELKRKHATLSIRWDEYIEQHPEGYRDWRFCELYGGWARKPSVTMRQTHLGGDKMFAMR